MTRITRSPKTKLPAETVWYLDNTCLTHTRRLSVCREAGLDCTSIPHPDCPPLVLTPIPRDVEGAVFDPERVDHVLDVLGRLRHTQGELAGQPLRPDPWQVAYIIAPVFGWVKPNGKGGWVRIIRKVYVEVPRKNGKTTLAGGLMLYLTTADGEMGAQVLAAASGKEQAAYCFDPIKTLAQGSPQLAPYVKVVGDKILHPKSGSYFKVVSRIADLLHGANVHAADIDELHVHKSPDLVRAIETGMGARQQPLLLIITTAGDESNETIYAKWHNRVRKLAKKTFADTSTYGVIWAASSKDDPFDEATWRKANPGYPISPTKQFLTDEATAAKQSPSFLASFKRLHLNIRTSATNKLFDLRIWDASKGPLSYAKLEETLAGRVCYAGLDLSQTRDLTAFGLVFPADDGGYDSLCRLWIPEEDIEARAQKDGVDYQTWVDQGLVRLTPGNAIDYGTIERDILADAQKYGILEIAFDPAFAWMLAYRLAASGLQMVPFRQGFLTMGPPTSDWLGLLKDKRFRHGGNPVLRYMAEATEAEQDMNGLQRPSKRKTSVHIDGIVALDMGLDRAMRHTADVPWGVM